MSKFLLAICLALGFYGCADADDDFEAESLDGGVGLKQQALGTACPAELLATQTSNDSRFNASGWTGGWYLTNTYVVWGARVCEYNAAPNATYWLGYTTTFTSCAPVAGTNKKGWLCGLTRVNCPDSSTPATPYQIRQVTGGPVQPWSAAGPANIFQAPVSQFTPNAASWDNVNKRLWCGYNQYTAYGTFAFSRPETY